MTTLDVILLSHVHGDHLLGFPYVVFSRTVQSRGLEKQPQPLLVIGNSATVNAAQTLLGACYPDRADFRVDWHVLSDGESLSIDDLQIKSFGVEHTVPTLAYRLEQEKVVGYTADTRPCEGLAAFFSNADLLILEAFGLRRDFEPIALVQKHLLADESGRLAVDANARRVLPFHMHLPYRDKAKMGELLGEIRSQGYGGEIICPEELMTIVV
jgi:ribonuclease BN (tRNA processing enzyme)